MRRENVAGCNCEYKGESRPFKQHTVGSDSSRSISGGRTVQLVTPKPLAKHAAEHPTIFYGWFVTIACVCITSTAFGVLYSFGVFFKIWLAEWSMSRAFLSGVFSLAFLIYGIASFVMGSLADRYGPRKTVAVGGLIMGAGCILTAVIQEGWLLYFVWGITVGIGVGTAYAPAAATVSRWFVTQKGLAMGIVVSGLGLGTVAFVPFSGFLINAVGWRTASLALGLIVWAVYWGGAFVIRRDPQELGLKPLGADSVPDGLSRSLRRSKTSEDTLSTAAPRSLTLAQAIRTTKLWKLFMIHGLWVVGMTIPLVHLVPYATDIGVTTSHAALIQALLGAMSVLGRVGLGVLTERMGPKASLIGMLWFQMFAMLWLIASNSEWMLWAFAVLFGISYGGLASVFPLLSGELFGLEALGAIFGLILLGATVGGTIGPTLVGVIFDSTKEYWGGFLVGAVSMAIGGIVAFSIPGRIRKQVSVPR